MGQGVIEGIESIEASNGLPVVAPGLVDLQINGYAGHDVNAQPLGDQTLSQMIQAMWREGVTTFFPTVITNSPQAILVTMTKIARSCEGDGVAGGGAVIDASGQCGPSHVAPAPELYLGATGAG